MRELTYDQSVLVSGGNISVSAGITLNKGNLAGIVLGVGALGLGVTIGAVGAAVTAGIGLLAGAAAAAAVAAVVAFIII